MKKEFYYEFFINTKNGLLPASFPGDEKFKNSYYTESIAGLIKDILVEHALDLVEAERITIDKNTKITVYQYENEDDSVFIYDQSDRAHPINIKDYPLFGKKHPIAIKEYPLFGKRLKGGDKKQM